MRTISALTAAFALLLLVGSAQAQVDTITREITRQTSGNVSNQAASQVIRPQLAVRGETAASVLGGDSNGRVAAILLAGNQIAVWDVERGQQTARFSNVPRQLALLAVGAAGREVAAATTGGEVLLISHAGQRRVAAAGGAVTALALSDDGRVAALARGGEISLIDAATGAARARAGGIDDAIALSFTPDGQSLRALTSRGRYITLNASGAIVSESAISAPALVFASIAPDGRRALGQDARGAVSALDLAQNTVRQVTARTRGRAGVMASANASLALLISTEEGRVQLWSLTEQKTLAQLLSTPRGWAVMDEDGRFDGSNDALADVVWQEGPNAYDLSRFADRYFEPGVLGRYWRGQSNTLSDVRSVSAGVAAPPTIEIVLPDELPKVAGAEYQVVVLARDTGGGLDAVRLYHNGRLVDRRSLVQSQDLQADGRAVRAAVFNVMPTSGANTFLAVAASTDDIEGRSERITANFSGPREQAIQHVLVVGVDDYQDLPDLNFAVADATGVANYFRGAARGGYTTRDVRTLFNAEASKSAVLAGIRDIARRSRPADVIVIYLAGHGFAQSRSEWRFAPSGARIQGGAVDSTTISAAELEAALTDAPARRIMLMIDACHSTAAFGAFVDQRDFYRRFFDDLSRTSGFAVLSAARSNAEAFELRTLGHGAFTYVVLQGLQGGADRAPSDGAVMVHELSSYVETQLPDVVLRYERVNQEAGAFVLGADFAVR